MKEKILNILDGKKNGLSFKTIKKRLHPRPNDEELKKALTELIVEGYLTQTNNGKYKKLKKRARLLKGEIQRFSAGFGFLLMDGEEDVFIPGRFLKGARTGDIVLVSLKREKRGKRKEGRVVKIVERKKQIHTGELIRKKKKWYIIPDDPTLGDMLPVKQKVKVKESGYRVSFYFKGDEVKLKRILGKETDPEIDYITVVERYELPEKFPKRVLNNAKALNMPTKYRGRKDIRDWVIFTIDPKTAKDFDDAISVEKKGKVYKLGVHIADVSHFVTPNSALDREARKREFSVYLIDKVIPMLPERLSNELCSLNPGEDRLTMSVIMDIDMRGRVLGYQIFPSVIHSVARLSYEDAEHIIKGEPLDDDSVSVFKEGYYKKVKDSLLLANELADILLKDRERRHSIDIDIPEPEIILDKDGKIKKIEIDGRLKSQKIIEEFMIRANVTVAEFMSKRNIPTIYRIHEQPDEEKLKLFFESYEKITRMKVEKKEGNLNSILYELLHRVKEEKTRKVISYLLLRSMMRARYSVENKGHFGLSLPYYLHFTSPIRRYPDLIVHRVLKWALKKRLPERTSLTEELSEIAELATRKEEIAQRAEWDITDYKILDYLKTQEDGEFEGVVINIIEHGVFINLSDFFIDGFIPVELFGKGAKTDEELVSVLVDGKTVLSLGDTIKVRILKVDKWRKRLDLVPADYKVSFT